MKRKSKTMAGGGRILHIIAGWLDFMWIMCGAILPEKFRFWVVEPETAIKLVINVCLFVENAQNCQKYPLVRLISFK